MKEITGDYRQFMDKNYFGSWDINGDELIVTIDHAEKNEVKNERGSELKLTIHLEGYKPLILNATNGNALSKALGTTKVEEWKGKKIILYKEKGKWFGKEGEAVRVREYAPKDEIFCEECGQVIKASNGMSPNAIAKYTKEKYGKQLCAACAKKAKEETGNEEDS